jgi:hypothetical protein
MDKYKELKYNGNIYTQKYQIEDILVKEKFAWIINCETYQARLEILNDVLVWNSGTFYNGIIKFLVVRTGHFLSAKWKDGVIFNGVFENLLFENGIIFNCTMIDSQILNAKLKIKNQNGSETRQTFITCDISPSVKKE